MSTFLVRFKVASRAASVAAAFSLSPSIVEAAEEQFNVFLIKAIMMVNTLTLGGNSVVHLWTCVAHTHTHSHIHFSYTQGKATDPAPLCVLSQAPHVHTEACTRALNERWQSRLTDYSGPDGFVGFLAAMNTWRSFRDTPGNTSDDYAERMIMWWFSPFMSPLLPGLTIQA